MLIKLFVLSRKKKLSVILNQYNGSRNENKVNIWKRAIPQTQNVMSLISMFYFRCFSCTKSIMLKTNKISNMTALATLHAK